MINLTPEAASWVAIALIAFGQMATWIKNGRSQSAKYADLKHEVKDTGAKVDSVGVKVDRMDRTVSTFKEHCAGVSGRLDERVIATERDIHELKSKVNKA